MLRDYLADLLENKPRKQEISRAINLQNKVKFFVDPVESDIINVPYKNEYLRTVGGRLDNFDSYQKFIKNTSYPLKINEFLDDIYTRLAKIWQGQNPYYNFEIKKEPEDYHDLVNLEWFKNDAWDEFRCNYNSIILTDLGDGSPENLFVKIDSVIDVLSYKNGIQHLIYELADEKIAVIDEFTWEIWSYKNQTLGFEPEISITHGLNRCPAVWLCENNFNTTSDIIKSNPLCKSIGKIEDLQIIYTLKNILSPYAFFQFIVKFKNDSACTYDDGVHYCESGYLHYKENNLIVNSNNQLARCPQCNKTPGVGDVIGKPLPIDREDPQLSNVIEFVAPDTQIMEYGDNYIKNLENDLFNNIIGTDEILNPSQNHNELAYQYNVEGEKDTIIRWKTVFESVISKVFDNVLELKYKEAYQSNVINLGTDFILAKLDNLYKEKEQLDKLGLTAVFDFNKTIINAKFNENPERKRRALIIEHFKPFDEPIENIEQSMTSGLIDRKDYIKMKYLSQFIKYFESNRLKLNLFDESLSIGSIVKILDSEFDKWYNDKFKTETI